MGPSLTCSLLGSSPCLSTCIYTTSSDCMACQTKRTTISSSIPNFFHKKLSSPSMKQKVVLKLQMIDEKARCKAFKIVVVQNGVLSVQIAGKEKDQLEVVGEEIDSVTMAIALRKKMGSVAIVSVAAVEQK